MSYKRVVKKKGKSYGPYIYESYRDESGKVKKRYLGKLEDKKVSVSLFFLVGFLIFGLVVGSGYTTDVLFNEGKVSGNFVDFFKDSFSFVKDGITGLVVDDEPVDEPVEEVVEDVDDEPVEEVVEEADEEPVDELVEEVVGGSGVEEGVSSVGGDISETEVVGDSDVTSVSELNETEVVGDKDEIIVEEGINETLGEEVNETVIPEINETLINESIVNETIINESIVNETIINESIVNETVEEINETLINESIVNETIINETVLNETIINETIINETLVNISQVNVSTLQYRAVINRPVKWLKKIDISDGENLTIELPKDAENISVLTNEEVGEAFDSIGDYGEVVNDADREEVVSGGLLTGNVALDIREGQGLLVRFWNWLTGFTISGNVILEEEISDEISDTENATIVKLENIISDESEVGIEYYTEAPQANETNLSNGKRVVVSAPDELNYTEILAYAMVDGLGVRVNDSRLKLYWYASREDAVAYGYINESVLNESEIVELNESEDIIEDVENVSEGVELNESVNESEVVGNETDVVELNESETINESGVFENVSEDIELNESKDVVEESNESFESVLTGNVVLGEDNESALNETEVVGNETEIVEDIMEEVESFRIEVGYVAYDFDSDGFVDYIEWIVPHLSEQVYDIVISEETSFSSNITVDNGYSHLTVSDVAPYDSLVGYWGFDGDDYEFSQFFTTDAQVGSGLNLDGDKDYISVPPSDSLNSNFSEMTVSFWIKPDLANHNRLFDIRGTSAGTTQMGVTSAGLVFLHTVIDGVLYNNDIGAGGEISSGGWYMITFVYNGTNWNYYRNESFRAAGSDYVGSVTSDGTSEYMYIGDNTANQGVNGTLDEFKIWNRSLSSTEISNLYNNESMGISDFNRTGLVGEWHLDNYTELGFAEDTSGMGNNGSIFMTKDAVSYDFSLNNHDGVYYYNAMSVPGLYGNSFSGGGIKNNIEVSSPDFHIASNITWGAWIKPSVARTNDGIVSHRTLTGDREGYNMYVSNYSNQVRVSCRLDNGTTDSSYLTYSEEAVNPGEWHHYMCIYNGTHLAQYKDGVLQPSPVSVPFSEITYPNDDQRLEIGKYYSGYDYLYFSGSIDEVMVFNSSLNSTQISEIYNNQSSRFVSSGTQANKQFNITSGKDTVNLSFQNYERNVGSNISARVGAWDVSLGYNTSDLSGENGLVGYWNFDSDYNDSSGNGNDGTAVDDVNLDSAGVWNNSASFDGVGDYVTIPGGFNYTQLTISAWINPATITGDGYDCIYDDLDYASDKGFSFMFTTTYNTLRFYGGNDNVGTTATGITPGNWYHLVATFDGSDSNNATIYINGVANASKKLNALTDYTSGTVDLGVYSRAYELNGSMDEVMIFNRSLASDEIKELYVKGRANYDYTEYQNFSDVDENGNLSLNIFDISTDATNIFPEVKLVSDEYSFYTPLFTAATSEVAGNLTVSDTIAPSVVVNEPLNNSNYNNSLVEVNVSASDANDLMLFNDYGLVSWWRMDDLNSTGGVVDYMGVNNGSVEGDAIQTDLGKFGKGFSFDGAGDLVSVMIKDDVNNQEAITFSSWVKNVNSDNTANEYLLTNIETSSIYIYKDSSEKFRLNIYNQTASSATTLTTLAYQDTRWHHVVGVYNGTYLSIYVDGSLDGTPVALTGGIRNVSTANKIGSAFNGTIDDVLIFNRSLSALEISALYANSSTKYLDANLSVSDGSRAINVYGQDVDGNVGVESANVYVDSVYPQISYVSPENDSNTNNASFSVNASISETGDVYAFTNLNSGLVGWWTMDDVGSSLDITNNGFESGDLTGWSVLDYSSRTSTAVISDGCYSGDYCLRVNSSVDATDTAWYARTTSFPVVAGRTYRLGFWSKHNIALTSLSGSGAWESSSFRWVNSTGDFFQDDNFNMGDSDTSWHYETQMFTAPVGAVNLSISFGHDSPNMETSNYLFIDDVTLEDISVYDMSGNGNNGTAVNDAVQVDSGKFGKGFSFDGAGDYVSVPKFLDFINVTTCVWIKTSATQTSYYERLFINDDSATYHFAVAISNGDIDTDNGTTPFKYEASGIINDDNWHHICALRNGGIYVDGVGVATSSGAVLSDSGTGFDIVGARQDGAYSFNGSIDDVLIFNRSLSASEISELYNASSGYYATVDGLSEGVNEFKTYAVDSAGNVNSTETRVINYDSVVPTLSVFSPVNTSWYNSSSVLVNVSSSEAGTGMIVPNLDSSLVSWWRMDDVSGTTVSDYIGGNDGTAVDDASQIDSGKFGKGFSFDGDGDYVSMPRFINNTLGGATISAWLNPASAQNGRGAFVQAADNYVLQFNSAGTIYCRFRVDGVNKEVTTTDTISLDSWSHVVCFYDNSSDTNNLNVYINGALSKSESVAQGLIDAPTASTYNLGTASSTSFNGSMDELMIFNRSLSSEEILALYNATQMEYTEDGLAEGSHSYDVYSQDLAGNVVSSLNEFGVDSFSPIIAFSNTPENGTGVGGDSIYTELTASDSNDYFVVNNFDDSLVSWWRMDDVSGSTVQDYIGGNDGSAEGDASQVDSGKFGKGFLFDGAGDYVDVPYTQSFNVSVSNSMTVSAWINPQGNVPATQVIAGRYNSGTNNRVWRMFYSGSSLDVSFVASSDGTSGTLTESASTGDVCPLNTWCHAVGVWNGTDTLIYVNGVLKDSDISAVSSLKDSNYKLEIGATTTGQNFNGSIDEVMIFNRSLNGSEISALYNASANQYFNNFTGLGDGVHTATGYAVDVAGNVESTEERVVYVDSSAPVVNVTYPLNDSYANYVSAINYSVDSADYCWYGNGTWNSSAVVAGTNWTNVNISLRGSNTFTVWCNDSANINSSSVVFGIDDVNPSVSITKPSENIYSSSSLVEVNGTVSDDNNAFSVWDSGLVSWWRMDDVSGTTVSDYIGGNDGTAVDDASQTDSGKFGKGFSFDGDGDYVDVGDQSSLEGISGITLSAWVKRAVDMNQDNPIVSKFWDGSDRSYYLYIDDDGVGDFRCRVSTDEQNDNDLADSVTIVTDGVWYHVVCTWGGADNITRIYVNGMVEEATMDQPGNTVRTNTENVSIGNVYDGTSERYFNGSIDEVMIFNRSLGEDEIKALYNKTYSAHADLPIYEGENNLTLYASDEAGNVNSDSVIVAVNTSSPVVTLNRPSNDSFHSSSDVNVNASVFGAGNVSIFSDKGLVSWWRMDDLNASGGVVDYMGRNNGSVVDDASQTDSGKFGKGFSFDGDGDRLDAGTDQSLNLTNNITISLWAKGYLKSGSWAVLVGKSDSYSDLLNGFGIRTSQTLGYQFWCDGGTVTKYINGVYNSSTYPYVGDGVWTHISLVCNGTMSTNANSLLIGGRGGADDFNGSIDEVMIFNRSLSASEISSLYGNQSTKYYNESLSFDEGENSVKVYSSDSYGNVGVSESNFEVDLTNPNLTVHNPSPGETISIDSVIVNATASDENNVSIVNNFDDSLVSWWRMDDLNASGGVVDYMGRNNGSVVDDASQTDSGKFGKGFSFDGDGDYVTVLDNDNLDFVDNATISLWIYPGSNDAVDARIITKRYDWELKENGNYPQVTMGGAYYQVNEQFVENTWNYVVITLLNISGVAVPNIYMNGILGTERANTFPAVYNNSVRSLGYQLLCGIGYSYTSSFNGSIDEVMIFNRSLSEDEISALYGNQSSKYYENNFSGLSSGSHSFTTYAFDSAGNVNSSGERSFTVDSFAINECMDITIPGVYTLSGDLSSAGTCMNISVDDVVLDGNGYEINSSAGHTIVVEGARDNVTIFNAIINSDTYSGVVFSGASSENVINDTVINTAISSCGDPTYYCSGIVYGSTSTNDVINGNDIPSLGTVGIYYLGVSDSNTITNNNISMTSGYGIYYDSSSANDILTNNNISTVYIGLSYSTLTNNTFTSNTLVSTSDSGIVTGASANNTFTSNDITSYYDGIYFGSTSSNDILTGNDIESQYYSGITFSGVSSNNIINDSNTINAGTVGCGDTTYSCSGIAYGSTSTNDLIDGNNQINSFRGPGIYFGSTSTSDNITGNTITSAISACDYGTYDCAGIVSVDTINSANIYGNTIFSDYGAGIVLANGAVSINITGNDITSGASGCDFGTYYCSGISYGSTSTGDVIDGNEITASQTDARGIWISGGSANNVTDNTITSGYVDIEAADQSVEQYSFSDISLLINDSSYGSVRFLNESLYASGANLSDVISITDNNAFINTTLDNGFNTTANITLKGLSLTEPKVLVDYNDDSSFEDCSSANGCYNLSYGGGVFVFNVSHFTSYQAAEASSLFGCGTLDSANTVYTLQNDLSTSGTCFNITADNVTLDGAGYDIIGIGGDVQAHGIYVEGRDNITIKNFANISGFDYATGMGYASIYFTDTNNSVVDNNTFTYNDDSINLVSSFGNNLTNNLFDANWWGIILNSGTNNNLINNLFDSNKGHGVYLDGNNNYLDSNNFTNCSIGGSYGCITIGGDNNWINSGIIDGFEYEGVSIQDGADGNNVSITSSNSAGTAAAHVDVWGNNNRVNGTFDDSVAGIGISQASRTLYLLGDVSATGTAINVTANNVTLDFAGFNITGDDGSDSDYGVYVNGYNDTTIKNGEIYDFDLHGIYLANNYYNNVSNMTSSSNGDGETHLANAGLYLDFSSNNTIQDSSFNSNEGGSEVYGVYLDSSEYNTLVNLNTSYNIVAANEGNGVRLDSSSNNNLSEITANFNRNMGIYVDSSSSNTLTNITTNSNNNYGIYLKGSSNTLTNITVNLNYDGIYLEGSSNIVTNNTFNSNINHGIYLGSSSNNNQLTNNNIWNCSTGGSYACISLAGSDNNVISGGVVNLSDMGLIKLTSGAENNSFSDMILTGATTYAVNDNTGVQNDYNNLTISDSTWDYYFNGASPRQYDFSGNSLEFGSSLGGVKFLNTSLTASGANLSDVISITDNNAFVNTTLDNGFNTTANITLKGLSLTEPKVLVDYNDDGSFEDCSSAMGCYNLSYGGGVFVFNVSHFTSYQAAEASSLFGCGTLDSANTVYTLESDLSSAGTCFNVTANNVTLDMNGYNITGDDGESDYGVYIYGYNDTTIKNGEIYDFGRAIYLLNNEDNNVTNLTLGSNKYYGVYLSSSNSNAVTEIEGSESDYNTDSSTVKLDSSSNNILTNIESNLDTIGIVLSSSNNNNLTNITLNATYLEGIYVTDGDNNKIINSTLTNIGTIGSPSSILFWSSNSLIEGSIITNSASYAISVSSAENVTIKNNVIDDTGNNGIYCGDLGAIITGNNITNVVGNGISINANFANVTNNNIWNCSSSCISINGADNNVISGGILNLSGAELIKLTSGAENNTFSNMTLIGATTYAVEDNAGVQNDYDNLTISDSTWDYYFNGASPRQYDFSGNSLEFETTSGSVKFLNTSLTASGANLSEVISVTDNNAFVNSSLDSGFNTTANITLKGLSLTEPKVLVDYNDDGSFEDCSSANGCYNLSYTGGIFVFNVSHFTSYRAEEASSLFGCGTLDSANTVYTLESDLSTSGTCFNITANNITLDLNGYNITGDGGESDYGVSVNGYNDTTIKDGYIYGMGVGISSVGGSGGNFTNMTINSNIADFFFISAMYIQGGSNNSITNNDVNMVANGAGHGIRLISTSNNIIRSNIANSNYGVYDSSGISLSDSYNNDIINNTVNLNNYYGIKLSSSSYNNDIINNTVNSNHDGIYLDLSSNNNTLTNITANLNYYGIRFDSSSNNTLTNITANSNHYGILLGSSSNNNTLTDITANSSVGYGIRLGSSSNNILTDITANSNGDSGVYIFSSYNNTLINTNIWNCSTGGSYSCIYVDGSDNNVFSEGTLNLSGAGVIKLISGAENNTFSNMSLIGATTYGVDDNAGVQNDYNNLTISDSSWDYYFYGASPRQYDFSGNSLEFGNGLGGVKFLNTSLTASGANLSEVISVTDNNAFVNSSLDSGFNTTANITLKGIGDKGYATPIILRDGIECNSATSPACYNLTSLIATNVIFNVSSWTNYSIGEGDTSAPTINSVTITPSSSGLGQTINITANVTDDSSVGSVWVGVTVGGSQINYTMTNTSEIFNYSYTNTWTNGTYSVTVYANDSLGNVGSNSSGSFDIYNDNITVQIRTLEDSYQTGQMINLTDPPEFDLRVVSGPVISNVYTDPEDVWPGDEMLISADVSDAVGVKSVEVEMPHEEGVDVLDMGLVSGDEFDGTWQTIWDVHDTLELNYTSIVRAENFDGEVSYGEVGWSDRPPTCDLLGIGSTSYSANVGEFVSPSYIGPNCNPILQDNTSASWNTMPTSDSDIDCPFCEDSLPVSYSGDVYCRSAGIYYIRYVNGVVVSPVATLTCNAAASGITYTEFADKGETTNLTVLNLTTNTAVSDLILDSGVGKISFKEDVILNESFDIDSVVSISVNSVSIDSTLYGGALNKSAEITMKTLGYGYPKILKDGVECSDCNIISWDASTKEVVFNVTSFSEYTAAEANQSKVQNNGTNNISFYLLMKTQWLNLTEIEDDTEDEASYSGTCTNPTNVYDENWSTSGTTEAPGTCDWYVNYTIPSDVASAVLEHKQDTTAVGGTTIVSIFCWNETAWKFIWTEGNVGLSTINSSVLDTCLTSDKLQLKIEETKFAGGPMSFYEEKVWWTKWQDEDIVINDTTARTVNASDLLKLDTLWNAQLYNSSNLSSGDGAYRVYVALQDDSGNVLSDNSGNDLSATFNFTLDNAVPYSVELNSPADDASIADSANDVSFNWTATDALDSSLTCNLTVDSVVEGENVVSANNTMVDYTVNDLAVGDHEWNVGCWDDAGNSNVSESWNVSIYVSNTAPNNPTPVINSTDGTNKTLQDLNCYATISDPDGDALNVSVQWYKDGVLNDTINYTGQANGTAFVGVLDDGNTTKADVWSCGLRVYDGALYSDWVNSSNLTIVNSVPTVNLSSPVNGANTTNRTPTFIWIGNDGDGDDLRYDINISLYYGEDSQTEDNRTETDLDSLTYTPSSDLQYLFDKGYHYVWKVRVSDGEVYSEWTPGWNISIKSLVSMSLSTNDIYFGNLAVGESNNTDEGLSPFVIENDGTVYINVSVNSSALWGTQSSDSEYYQFKADNDSTESNSFDWLSSVTNWFNMPLTGYVVGVNNLSYVDSSDTVEVDINITVPANEEPGIKNSTIVFLGELAE